jgi:hypothetical protein
MKTYEQGDAIRIEITVKQRSNRAWALYNPSAGCNITIYGPNKDSIISGQSMTNEGTGLYYYNWQSAADSDRGVYEVRIVADDGSTQGTRQDRLFELK